LIRDGEEKFLLRQALRGLIPDAVRLRRKHPFMAPPLIAQPPLLELLRAALDRCPPFYSQAALASLIARLPQLPEDELKRWEPPLFLFLSATALQEELMR
jgi:asparagine synthase (glutamine-hydrolysing)